MGQGADKKGVAPLFPKEQGHRTCMFDAYASAHTLDKK